MTKKTTKTSKKLKKNEENDGVRRGAFELDPADLPTDIQKNHMLKEFGLRNLNYTYTL
ncbi:hypothetical protein MTR_5g065395 [Medicago truncatula]|uniref:Uncharacterized protein n=1 Tax=Medicago truncatula TaxID=3880 RepID=A0A072UG47_MEDTR|nr:hypothetical protein MTR_5g065395 [Medicago truncatula]